VGEIGKQRFKVITENNLLPNIKNELIFNKKHELFN